MSDLKPDWFDEISLFSIKKLNILLNINLSRIFPQIGNNDTGRYFLSFCLSLFCEWEQYYPFTIQKEKHEFQCIT